MTLAPAEHGPALAAAAPCGYCGYDLRATAADGVCPECGVACGTARWAARQLPMGLARARQIRVILGVMVVLAVVGPVTDTLLSQSPRWAAVVLGQSHVLQTLLTIWALVLSRECLIQGAWFGGLALGVFSLSASLGQFMLTISTSSPLQHYAARLLLATVAYLAWFGALMLVARAIRARAATWVAGVSAVITLHFVAVLVVPWLADLCERTPWGGYVVWLWGMRLGGLVLAVSLAMLGMVLGRGIGSLTSAARPAARENARSGTPPVPAASNSSGVPRAGRALDRP